MEAHPGAGPGHTRRPQPPGWARVLAALLLVGAVLGSLVVVVLHLTYLSETSYRFMGLTGIAPLVGAAAALAGALGAAVLVAGPRGQRLAPTAALALIPWLVVAGLTAPTLVASIAPERATQGQPVDVVVQNLWYQHADPDRAAQVVLGRDADVVVLVEFTPEHERAMLDAGAIERYPHQLRRPAQLGDGIAVMSNVALRDGGDLGLRSPSIEVELALDAGPVTLLAVHPVAPSDVWGLRNWRTDYETLSMQLGRVGPDVIVAGDFNATMSHRRFRSMVAEHGLREAHQVAGIGPGLTWPARFWLVPPVMRLDHILVGEGLGVQRAEVVRGAGSDHLGVAARLRFPRS